LYLGDTPQTPAKGALPLWTPLSQLISSQTYGPYFWATLPVPMVILRYSRAASRGYCHPISHLTHRWNTPIQCEFHPGHLGVLPYLCISLPYKC